ncbi:uncharacterized protein F5891DRAFT_932634, partial [Suillus fuscotomentosus]
AQAEIDAVVGQDQFPAFEDRVKLLYIDLRGLPRHVMREDVYEGYSVLKGAIVIVSILSISQDNELYL